MFVLAVGNPFDGIELIGPFTTVEDAENAADAYHQFDWWILKLNPPVLEETYEQPNS